MKKILFSLLMLCSMTAAWAGSGDGSKEHPYAGEWTVTEMAAKLKAGNYLAYDCVINVGNITVTDSKLNEVVATNKSQWTVGELIGSSYTHPYCSYCFYNDISERQKQKFFVTSVDTENLSTEMVWLKIKGHYTGQYTGAGNGSSVNPYTGKWHAADLAKHLKVGDRLAYDCVIKDGSISVTDSKLDMNIVALRQDWTVAEPIGDNHYSAYNEYCSFNSNLADRKKQMFTITGLNSINPNEERPYMMITGYYTGIYSRGDGSAELPYAGDSWASRELLSILKIGDHLDYSCVVDGGEIYVYDDKLNNAQVAHRDYGEKWVVSDAIDETPSNEYEDYCIHNGRNDRKKHTFLITQMEKTNIGEIDVYKITGHYSGAYENTYPDYIDVRDGYGLKKVIESDNSAKIQLKADIDISDLGTICDSFKGSINGLDTKYVDPDTGEKYEMMFTIYGGREEGKTRPPMFNETRGAKFENLFFHSFNLHDNDHGYLGAIAKSVHDTEFTNITLNRVHVFSEKTCVGSIAGLAYDCKFNQVVLSYCGVNTDSHYAGGMIASSERSEYNNCVANMGSGVFADGTLIAGGAYSGGLVGESYHDVFTGCINMGVVSGNEDSVGGIVGISRGFTTFTGCQNSGLVFHGNEDEYSEICDDVEKYIKENGEYIELLIEEMDLDGMAIGSAGLTTAACLAGAAGGFIGYGVGHGIAWFLLRTFSTDLLYFSDWGAIITNGCGLTVAAAAAIFAYFAVQAAAGHDEIGGICGYAKNGDKFDMCLNAGKVRCIQLEGGCIVGRASNTTINNCFNSGELVGGDKHQCGSILGSAEDDTKVTNCLSTFSLPIVGKIDGLHAASGNNYCPPTEKILYYKGYEGVPLEVLASGVVTRWLNDGVENRDLEVKPWRQNLVAVGKKKIDAFPTILNHDEVTYDLIQKTVITSAKELYDFSQKQYTAEAKYGSPEYGRWFDCVQLGNDIDLSEYEKFPPIGSYAHPYCGIFDGNGHVIKGLKVNVNSETQPKFTNMQGAGLFGNIGMHAEIRNIVVDKNSVITSASDAGAGGIVGTVWNGGAGWNEPIQYGRAIIEYCGSEATVNAPKHAGGILGRIREGEYALSSTLKTDINYCYSTGTITASEGHSGLLCGYLKNHANVSNCWSSGWLLSGKEGVKPYDDNNNKYFAGFDEKLNITDCYAIEPSENVQNASSTIYQNGVEDVTNEEAAIGKLTNILIQSWGKSFWQQNIGTDPYPVRGDKGLYQTRNIKNQYGTVCLRFPLKSDDKVSYYQFVKDTKEDGDIKLNFEYVDEVAPGTPVLFRAAEVKDATADETVEVCFNNGGDGFAAVPVPAPVTTWQFEGTFKQESFEGSSAKRIYYISGDKIRNAQKTTIAPYRAYFIGPSVDRLTAAGAKSISFVIEDEDGEVTAIEVPELDTFLSQEGWDRASFNLAGQKVDENYRGIVIKNGRKVLRK